MIRRWLWGWLRPALAAWLYDRALRLPADDALRLAQEAGVPVEAVRRVNDAFVVRALAGLDAYVP